MSGGAWQTHYYWFYKIKQQQTHLLFCSLYSLPPSILTPLVPPYIPLKVSLMPKSPAIGKKALRRLDITRRASETVVRPPSPRGLPSLLSRHSVEYNDAFSMHLGHLQVSIDAYHRLYDQGKLIGQYVLYIFVFVLTHARGATSTVYAVTEKSTGHNYAVKVIPKKKILSSMFPVIAKEIAILKRLNHDNIIKMHDTLITEENLYIITDLYVNIQLA